MRTLLDLDTILAGLAVHASGAILNDLVTELADVEHLGALDASSADSGESLCRKAAKERKGELTSAPFHTRFIPAQEARPERTVGDLGSGLVLGHNIGVAGGVVHLHFANLYQPFR